jgi:hypothetical protein
MTTLNLNQDKINELMNDRFEFSFRNYDEGEELPESASVVIAEAPVVNAEPVRFYEGWSCEYIGRTDEGAVELVVKANGGGY